MVILLVTIIDCVLNLGALGDMKLLIYFLIAGLLVDQVHPDTIRDYIDYFIKEGFVVPIPVCLCAVIGMHRCIKFTLHTRKNPDGVDVDGYNMEDFDKNKKTIIWVHGWFSIAKNIYVRIAKVYLENQDINVVIVNWRRIAYNCYFLASSATSCVGRYIAKFMIRIIQHYGANPKDFHVVAHSLGVHVASNVGSHFYRMYGTKVARITGLDPAKPYFTLLSFFKSLVKTDAEFVDVLHSCIDFVLGSGKIMGHMDIYVNGGSCYEQPHCSGRLLLNEATCAHFIPVLLLEYTIKHGPLETTQCTEQDEYSQGCSGPKISWGSEDPKHANGVYYIKVDTDIKLEQ